MPLCGFLPYRPARRSREENGFVPMRDRFNEPPKSARRLALGRERSSSRSNWPQRPLQSRLSPATPMSHSPGKRRSGGLAPLHWPCYPSCSPHGRSGASSGSPPFAACRFLSLVSFSQALRAGSATGNAGLAPALLPPLLSLSLSLFPESPSPFREVEASAVEERTSTPSFWLSP